MNHNYMQTQISSFVLVFLMLSVRYNGTSIWLFKQQLLCFFFTLYLCGEPKFDLWLTLKVWMKIVMYTFAKSFSLETEAFFCHQVPDPCTALGSGSLPYTSPVFCPMCQNPSPALCRNFLPRHSSACVTCWNSLPRELDSRFYLYMLLFGVHTEICEFGIWRLLSSSIQPVWREEKFNWA